MKIKLFTHTDLDGVGCAILAYHVFGKDTVDVSYCDYDDIDTEVKLLINDPEEYEKFNMIFITDIKVSEEVAEKIDKDCDNVRLLDHHPTAEYLKKYDWCTIQVEREVFGETTKTCGTELFYEWCNDMIPDKIMNPEPISKMVDIIRNYDTWRWASLGEAGLISKKVNNLLYLYGRDMFINWALMQIYQNEFPILTESDKLILDIEQKKVDRYIDSKEQEMVQYTVAGYTAGLVFAEMYTSELGNTLAKRHPELDFIVMIDMGEKSVSYRSVKDNIDLGKDVAAKFGGGGHPKAAGHFFGVRNKIDMDNFLRELFMEVETEEEKKDE